ncbi:helix-turn-helix domain-containing protein [Planctomicrobium piriforme]|nr:AraC family transcriptional regulator [Planctomicrobium piriforme]
MGRVKYHEVFSTPPVTSYYLSTITRSFTDRTIVMDCGGVCVRRQLKPGNVMIVPPNLDWSVIGDGGFGGGSYEGLFVAFPENTFQEITKGMPRFEVSAQCVNDPCLASDLKQLWAYSEEASPASELMAEGMMLLIIGRLAKLYGGRESASDVAERSSGKIVAKAVNFIRDNLSVKVTLADIAKASGVSRPYLSRVFKRETGKTIHDHLLELRVEKAKELIRHFGRGMTLSEVARQCGFASHSHLQHTFLRYVGVTPQRFRE